MQTLANWRAALPDVSNAISASSLCSNCKDHIDNGPMSSPGNKPSIELWMEIETRCNLSCRFCYNFWRGGLEPAPKAHTTQELIGGWHRLLTAVDCNLLTIAGGEPLLRRDLVDILRSIKHFLIPTALATNGVLLSPAMIRELQDAGVGTFQVPLHSHLESCHDELSGGSSWLQVIKTFISLRELGAHVVPVFVATRLNLKHFASVVEFCALFGLRQVIFNRFVPVGQGAIFHSNIGLPTLAELESALERADQVARRHNITITLGVPIEVPSERRIRFKMIDWTSCPVFTGQSRWSIGPDLEIKRCNSFKEGIGNLLKDGLDTLLAELREGPNEPSQFRPCKLLETSSTLLQIQRSRF
jgi:MoaA/NifB/PqqE/SkfB family radical SAM enzyme